MKNTDKDSRLKNQWRTAASMSSSAEVADVLFNLKSLSKRSVPFQTEFNGTYLLLLRPKAILSEKL